MANLLNSVKELMVKLNDATNGNGRLVIIAVALLLILHIITTVVLTISAKKKGRHEWGYFFLCLLLGVPGYCMTAAQTDLTVKPIMQAEADPLDSQNELCTDSGTVIPRSDAEEPAPKGAVAYVSKSANDTTAQEQAADKLRGFWDK